MLKLQFKHQKFQADAAKAVVDVFAGQPYLTPTYLMDRGTGYQQSVTDEEDFTGWRNERIVPELTDKIILEHLQKVQRANQIKPSDKLEGHYNLTIEMETGVGKTYTYIKTMYELNKHYGWSKFIVVVPSIAIREGVYKSFQVTQEHFAEEYGKKIRFFIYNSSQLTEIDRFASDSSINVMIINSQAFNAKGKDARRIYMKLDEFRSRRPIDIIAKTNPIMIIDEPQSVEGAQTKERLKEFCPLLTLRYSATHKADSIYNMVYRLDAMEAYNKRLVKKIAVKGITESGSTATESYVYLEGINLSKADPTATLQFDYKGAAGLRKKTMKVGIGFNLYDNSGYLDEYRNGFVVKFIDGRDNSVEFLNGIKIYAGDVIGKVSENILAIYSDICKLAVLSGLEIDKAKRTFEDIRVSKELTALRKKYARPSPQFFAEIDERKTKQYAFYPTAMDYLYARVKKLHFRKGREQYEVYRPISSNLSYNISSGNATEYRHKNKIVAIIDESKAAVNRLYQAIRTADEQERKVLYAQIADIKKERDKQVSKWLTNENVLILVLRHYEKNSAADWRVYAALINHPIFSEFLYLSPYLIYFHLYPRRNGRALITEKGCKKAADSCSRITDLNRI